MDAALVAEEDVLGHGHVRHRLQVLIDQADAESASLRWTRDPRVLPGEGDGACIGLFDPGQDSYEGRLARPVLAYDGDAFAGGDREVDPAQSNRPAEPLGNAARLERQNAHDRAPIRPLRTPARRGRLQPACAYSCRLGI